VINEQCSGCTLIARPIRVYVTEFVLQYAVLSGNFYEFIYYIYRLTAHFFLQPIMGFLHQFSSKADFLK